MAKTPVAAHYNAPDGLRGPVNDNAMVLAGSETTRENASCRGKPATHAAAPDIDWEWCRLQDSNL